MSAGPMCLFNLLKLHYDFIVGDINRLFALLIVVSLKPSSGLLLPFFACNQIHIKRRSHLSSECRVENVKVTPAGGKLETSIKSR
jgi:hypothetical protein